MIEYNPKDWYWIVAGDETRAYSSKAGDYVPSNDAAYLAWVNSGGLATRIISEGELGEVLAPYALRPVAAGVLDAYKDSQASKLTVETVAKVCFNLNNRVLALEGKPTLNAVQFKAVLKGLM